MKIKIIAVGKTRNKWIQDGESEYVKRLKKYATVDFVIVPEIGKGDKQRILDQEADRILNKLKSSDFVCLLSVNGNQLSSVDFSDLLQKWDEQQGGNITFIIGGSFGVSEKIEERADYKLSFSKMTFLHEMIRIFLLEQLYRGFSILRGAKYHKGDKKL